MLLQYSLSNMKGAATYDAQQGKCINQKTPKRCSGLKVQTPAPEFCSAAEASLGTTVSVQALHEIGKVASEGAQGVQNAKFLDISVTEKARLAGVKSQRINRRNTSRRPLQLAADTGITPDIGAPVGE
jgi:hypothetical protein